MTCCIEKSSIFAAAFGKCIYKVSNIQYYFNQKNMNYSCKIGRASCRERV